MFCPVCRKQNEDTAVYCAFCGAAMSGPAVSGQPGAPAAAQPTYTPPSYRPVTPPAAPVVPENPVIAAVKETASSPAFLVAAIAFTLSIVLSFASAFTFGNSMTNFMEQMFSIMQNNTAEDGMYFDWETGEYYDDDYSDYYGGDTYEDMPSLYDEDFSSFVDIYDAIVTGSMVAAMIPSLVTNGLMAAALWMLYAAGKKRNQPGMSTAGLTILKVMTIIGLVGIIAVAALFLLLFGIMILVVNVAPEEFGSEAGIVSVVFGVLLVVIAAIFAFAIFYQAKVLQSINTAKKTLTTGVPSDKVSLFVAVMCFISGGMNGMSALSLVVLGDFFVLLGSLAGAAASIAFGLVIIQYRNRMRAFVPVGGMPPVQPAAPYVQAQNYYGVPAPGYPAPPAPPAPAPVAAPAAEPAPVDEIPGEAADEQ